MPGHKSRQQEIAVVRPAQPRSSYAAVAGATERRLVGAMEVPLEQVVPDPEQPRRNWEHDEGQQRLQELADSIKEFGLLQPLLVREEGTLPDGRQRYMIIAGARRRAAAEMAGLAMLPVVVRGDEQARIRILQLIENLQRQNLSWLDEARAYQELMDSEGMTPPALAAQLHISAQHVRDRLRVLADQVLADAVERRQISATAARDIKQLPDEEVMAFRARILAGERLQTNDVAVARARLAAEGKINPRRKIAREPAGSLSATAPEAQSGPGTIGEPEKQTPFVSAGLGAGVTVPLNGQMATVTESPVEQQSIREAEEQLRSERLMEGATGDGIPALAGNELDELYVEARGLIAGLSVSDRQRFGRLLEIANLLGWSNANVLERLESQP